MTEPTAPRKLGFWMSRKKYHKMDWVQFKKLSQSNDFQLIEVDLDNPIDAQGPFTVFLHKLTDIITKADQGDQKSRDVITEIENYIEKNPNMITIDPLDNVRILLDRCKSYNLITNSNLPKFGVKTPNYVELLSTNVNDNIKTLNNSKIGYPFICKSSVAHGSGNNAHKMVIIFNENSVKDCLKPPCVAQKFILHNAILYKIFVVGDRYQIVERPSLKNFKSGNSDTINFDSSDISKATSHSKLTVLDDEDKNLKRVKPNSKYFKMIVTALRSELGMALFGVDVIIENSTGAYYIIDVNAYPGYDGYPEFFEDLFFCINNQKKTQQERHHCSTEMIKKILEENDSGAVLNQKYLI